MSSRLRATYRQARAPQYRRPGGPWDRGALDGTFSAVAVAPGSRVELFDGITRLDAAAVEDHVAVLAGRLRASGVRHGAVVAWQLPNSVAPVLLYRACWRLGAIAAPLHHRLGPAEVAAALEQVDPLIVIAAAAMPAADQRHALVATDPVPCPADVVELLAAGAPIAAAASSGRAKPTDLAVALFSSGSTGMPKAILHTHRALGYKAALMAEVHGLHRSDAVLMPAPLAHVSGLLNGVLLPAAAGIPSIIMSAWDPDEGLRRIAEERVSFMGAPPVFFSQMASSPAFSATAVSSLRLVSTGGASVSPAFVTATAEAFGCRVKRTYGSSEAPTVTTSGPDDSVERARDTDGRAVGEVELEVRDPDTGARLRPGEVGELWLRGPEMFVGDADPVLTASVIARPGGWFRTGDLGAVDDEGWLRVMGRISDTIIRAGENISASEVEAALEAHPDIRLAVAVGVPDTAVGERVAAFVESTAPFDLAMCRAWFAERGVTRFKTPEYVIRLDAVPTLAAGKPDKAALRKMAADLGSG
jgi:cyclohexanecarboxylate-CoA ligase